MDCSTVLPVSSFYSTNLNSKICSYDRLAQRISRTLGAPLINIEVHQDNLYENIGIAVEMFTKFGFSGFSMICIMFSFFWLIFRLSITNSKLTFTGRVDVKIKHKTPY